ncbi:hypothetical protein ECDEC14D_5322, partial [Escherichia coli DEC14D]
MADDGGEIPLFSAGPGRAKDVAAGSALPGH